MPTKDRYHDVVKRALVKDGWEIIDEQVTLQVGERYLWVEIEASNQSFGSAILVEVKELEEVRSPVEALANAVGKYILYKAALNFWELDTALYLAVTDVAYKKILSEPLAQQIFQLVPIPLLVFSVETEEVVAWVP